MIDALKEVIKKEIKKNKQKPLPKTLILKLEDNTEAIKLPKPSK